MSEFSMFYKLFGCMHACILHVLSVGLTRVVTFTVRVTIAVSLIVTDFL